MSNQWELMLMYADGELRIEEALKIEKSINENMDLRKGYVLNRQINESMRVHLMLEQIKSDPGLEEIERSVRADVDKATDIADYSDTGLAFYIKGALETSKNIEYQIDEAERELHKYALEELTSSWVNSFMQEREHNRSINTNDTDIVAYIRQGMVKDTTPQMPYAPEVNRRKMIYRIAAAAAIVILTLGLWTLLGSKPGTEELFAEYYRPYQITDGQTRNNGLQDEDLIKILTFYREGDYGKAAMQSETWLKHEKRSPKVLMIYGISQLELNHEKKAIDIFRLILNEGGEFSIEAKWYLALSFLKTGEIGKSKQILVELSETPGMYKSMAKELLREL